MEANITAYVAAINPRELSASAAELGDNAGRITWAASLRTAEQWGAVLLPDADSLDTWRAYVRTWGAWDDEEISGWSDHYARALFCQHVAAELRDADIRPDMSAEDWARVEAGANAGQVSGAIGPGDDGQVYIYVGS